MEIEKLNYVKSVFDKFKHESEFDSCTEFSSGHINDTYFVQTKSTTHYVLQKINHGVFKDVPGLINNKTLISEHILTKLNHLPKEQRERKTVVFQKCLENNLFYYKDEEGNFWNMMVFINDSVTHELVLDTKTAYEGGKLLGEFLNLTNDFDASKLIDVIPNFHNMAFRYQQYKDALQNANDQRKLAAKECILQVDELIAEMLIIQQLKDKGEIPLRVTHNDTKISNTLFDKNNNGLCMIDTDTVMTGIVHYDFGDAIRTICNTAAEDEKDLTKVTFNVDLYDAYKKGFLEQMENVLTEVELKHLPLAVKTMIFIMAIRFLTDYLNNDVYYKTEYSDHNLVRAKNQFKLIDSFSEKMI